MYRYHCKLHMCTCMSQYNHGDRHTSGYGCKLSPTLHKIIIILPSHTDDFVVFNLNTFLVTLIISILMDAYSRFLLSLHWIPHHIAHHYRAHCVLGKTDEKKKLHAKRWITIGRVYKIQRPRSVQEDLEPSTKGN